MEDPSFLGRSGIGSDTVIPPSTFAFREVGRQFHEEAPLPVIFLLIPLPRPLPSPECMGFEPSILVGIRSIALRIKLKNNNATIFILPLSC